MENGIAALAEAELEVLHLSTACTPSAKTMVCATLNPSKLTCDTTIKKDLKALPEKLPEWPQPASKGTEESAKKYIQSRNSHILMTCKNLIT
ncbi:hypothetical protein ACIGHN_00045 [Acidovorax sp. NPDC077693]|uniref:hypothetical protein n=1 Tax=unclassified Acidovorax TaxID=2684926 RepID=UPI0037C6941C